MSGKRRVRFGRGERNGLLDACLVAASLLAPWLLSRAYLGLDPLARETMPWLLCLAPCSGGLFAQGLARSPGGRVLLLFLVSGVMIGPVLWWTL